MDDGPEGQPASTGFDLAAERNRPMPRQLLEWLVTGPALDGNRNGAALFAWRYSLG